MTKTITFDKYTVDAVFIDLTAYFERSEEYFKKNDLLRNIVNATSFQNRVRSLMIYGADTDTGTYGDGDYLRIGYARINGHEFVKSGKIKYEELQAALNEIADSESE